MRIISRPDFDGIVCAALLYEAENITGPVKWVQPGDMQKGLVDIEESDIIANLPYDPKCALWFDHHYTNQPGSSFKGLYKMAPSAAGVIFEYYKCRFRHDYRELIYQTDKIDSADLSMDEVVQPEKYDYITLSMTVSGRDKKDEPYWNKLAMLLRKCHISDVLNEPEVKERCKKVVEQNKEFKQLLLEYTRIEKHIAITDFRPLKKSATGNRFLVYPLFPQSVVSMRISYLSDDQDKVTISVGHNIFNQKCNVNVGRMLAMFEGGGHRGAGGCCFHVSKADEYIPRIIDILLKNEPDE